MARRKPARASKPAARKRSAKGKKRVVAAKPRLSAKKRQPARPRTRRSAPRTRKETAVAKRAVSKRTAPRPKVRTVKALKRRLSRPRAAKKVLRKTQPTKVKPTKPLPRVRPAKTAVPVVAKKAVATPPPRVVPKAPVSRKPVRKSPAVQRERRSWDEDVVPGPPSSLDLDRSASSARSGRREMLERYEQHTETSPEITGGDVDADWESAYTVGDEAPGGDNPTPDQGLVDDIGEAVGLVYEDNEELEGETKVTGRDKHRWELDPASSDDFKDR